MSRARADRPGLGEALAAGAAAGAAFFGLGSPLLRLTGPWYDEAVHGALAAGLLRDGFAAWGPSPWSAWMKDPYQGALKAYLLAGSFSLFGVSVETMRATTLGLGALAAAAFAAFAWRRHGRAAGLLTALLVAADPSTILAAAHDSGPVALSLALKGLAALALGEAALGRAPRGASFAAGLLLGLGVWDKAHFLWILIAAPPALWLAARLRRAGGEAPAPPARAVSWLIAGLLLGALPLVAYNAATGLGTFRLHSEGGWRTGAHLAALPHWLAERGRLWLEALAGLPGHRASGGEPGAPWHAAAAAAAALACVAASAEAAFWLALALGVFACAAASPVPVKWHHVYALTPFLPLAAAAALPRAGRTRRAVALALAAAAAALGAGRVLAFRDDARERGGGPHYSAASRRLAAAAASWLEGAPDRVLACAAGLDAPLLVASGGRAACASFSALAWTHAEDDRAVAALLASGKLAWAVRTEPRGTESVVDDPLVWALQERLRWRDESCALDPGGRAWGCLRVATGTAAEILAAWRGALDSTDGPAPRELLPLKRRREEIGRSRLAPKPSPKPKAAGEPPAARAALHAGHSYQAEGRLAAARAKFAHAARLGLAEARAEIALVDAESRARAGDAAGSAAAARAALAASPTTAQSQRAAVFLQKAGRAAEAARVFDALLAREPGRSSLLSDRGIARFLAGDAAGAERDLRAALAADPGNEAARSSLEAVLAAPGRAP